MTWTALGSARGSRGQTEIMTGGVTEERILFEIAVQAKLVLNAADPVAIGISEYVTT